MLPLVDNVPFHDPPLVVPAAKVPLESTLPLMPPETAPLYEPATWHAASIVTEKVPLAPQADVDQVPLIDPLKRQADAPL